MKYWESRRKRNPATKTSLNGSQKRVLTKGIPMDGEGAKTFPFSNFKGKEG